MSVNEAHEEFHHLLILGSPKYMGVVPIESGAPPGITNTTADAAITIVDLVFSYEACISFSFFAASTSLNKTSEINS